MTEPLAEFEAEYSLIPDTHVPELEAEPRPKPRPSAGLPARRFRRTENRSLLRQTTRGAVSSLAASTLMGAVLLAAKKLGLLGEDPPRKLTRKTLDAVGIRARGDQLDAPTAAMHIGYGAMVGAVTGPLLERLESRPLRILGGVATGAAVWAVSYAGWIPAIGWMPAPHRDTPPARPWVMLGAHLIFGAALGAALPSRSQVYELDLNDDPHVEALGL